MNSLETLMRGIISYKKKTGQLKIEDIGINTKTGNNRNIELKDEDEFDEIAFFEKSKPQEDFKKTKESAEPEINKDKMDLLKKQIIKKYKIKIDQNYVSNLLMSFKELNL